MSQNGHISGSSQNDERTADFRKRVQEGSVEKEGKKKCYLGGEHQQAQ